MTEFTKVLVLSKNLNLITTVSVATTVAGTMGTSWGQGEWRVRPRPWLWRIHTKWRVEWKNHRKTIGNMDPR
jgi:hypothetical protein